MNTPNIHDVFHVYLGRKWIDTVHFLRSQKFSREEIYRSLVNHDGYDPAIRVTKARKAKKAS